MKVRKCSKSKYEKYLKFKLKEENEDGESWSLKMNH